MSITALPCLKGDFWYFPKLAYKANDFLFIKDGTSEPLLVDEMPDTPTGDLGMALVSAPVAANLKVDVVFVHGLRGHRTRTWTNANKEFWLSWLEDSVPEARIWTYGYNSRLWLDNSKEHLTMHSKRFLAALAEKKVGEENQVVLVGHSLGGILIKSSLIEAHTVGRDYSYLWQQTRSVVFLGTPHRGSAWASRLYLTQLWGPQMLKQSSAFLDLLRAGNSSVLISTAEKFNNLWGARPILTFRECSATSVMGLIVKLEDARTNCENEKVVDIRKDHRNIARPTSRKEEVYAALVNHIKHLGAEDASAVEKKPHIDIQPRNQEGEEKPKGDPLTLAPRHLKFLRGGLKAHYGNPNGDKYMQPIFEEEGVGGIFMGHLHGHESTRLVLRIPSNSSLGEIAWSIHSPNSEFHPGQHEGYFRIHREHPFKPPRIYWTSPILSPYVSNRAVCWDKDSWSPYDQTFYELLHSLAAIVVMGPGLQKPEFNPELAFPQYTVGVFGTGVTIFQKELRKNDDRPSEWMLQACNFFSRAFNRTEDIEDDDDVFPDPEEKITDAHRQMSIQGVNAYYDHVVLVMLPGKPPPRELGGLSPADYFSNKVKTVQEWVKAERDWAVYLRCHD